MLSLYKLRISSFSDQWFAALLPREQGAANANMVTELAYAPEKLPSLPEQCLQTVRDLSETSCGKEMNPLIHQRDCAACYFKHRPRWIHGLW